MTCEECTVLIDAYHDGELSLGEESQVRGHIASCESCTARLQARRSLTSALKKALPEQAPEALRRRIDSRLKVGPRASFLKISRLVALAACFAFAFLGGRLTAPNESLSAELFSAHSRSLLGAHMLDVQSSDRHTVKPFFAGKSDLTATPFDLKSIGFPLIGGRLDFVNGSRTPVFVYKRQAHFVDVYVLPGHVSLDAYSIKGCNFTSWFSGDETFVAASDASFQELSLLRSSYVSAQALDSRPSK